ncbi:MAG: prolyl oligopeptidase family serine peptidase [Hyphomonadaceae bacterium]
MSREGDFLVGLVADPRDEDLAALAVWDLTNLDPNKPLQISSITPTSGKMMFRGAGALKAGAVFVQANQPWTGNLNGCGEGRSTGATKTWVRKLYLTDKTIKKFEQPFAQSRKPDMTEIMRKCLEIAGTSSVVETLPLDDSSIIISRLDTASLENRFYKVDLKTQKSELLFRDIGNLQVGLLDRRTGDVLTRGKIEPKGDGVYDIETYILNRDTGNFDLEAPLTTTSKGRHDVSVLGFDEKTGKYFVATDKFSDKTAIYLYDAKTDKFDDEVVFAHPDYDASGVILGDEASNFGKILGFRYAGPYGNEVYWVDAERQSIQAGLEKAFPGQEVSIQRVVSAERAGDGHSRILFSTNSPRNPDAYYLLIDGTKVQPIGGERPWIDPNKMGERQLVYYTARDGMKIPAFLTLPPGWKKGDPAPPAVVHPHGGPWARDNIGWDFSGWTQYLATRGYAVLQPQYRGSQGWGHELWVAGDNQWGLKMQDDKDDGAKWLVEEGYANPDKIAIFGYSYGGFAAFAAAVRPNGPFRCAIAGAGVANLGQISNNWSENRVQRALQGRTVDGMDPQKNTSKLSMPILIFHGDRDVRVPLSHSTDFYNSVKSTGKAKLMVVKDMGHQGDLWTPKNTRDTLKAIGDFLKSDCGF